MWDCPELMTSLPQEMPSLKTLQMLEIRDCSALHDVVQHFDHVLHHLSSTAVKEHVPATAYAWWQEQRGMMEATVIKI
ncbi:hypothetical protein CK203_048530 [Vitis vinifera]|uniref:Disease resistance protein n=1 Tax=Vitis vinifera TaxID=29760 RepID=A0A438FXA0_VITVI|nr:hypothetical protein CK203_048530 [Vitis vinifera]